MGATASWDSKTDFMWLDVETGDVMVDVQVGDLRRPVTAVEVATIDPHHLADLESAYGERGAFPSGLAATVLGTAGAEAAPGMDGDSAIDSFIQRHELSFPTCCG